MTPITLTQADERADFPVGSIRWAQTQLNALHTTMLPFDVDGRDSAPLRAAIARFQSRHGLFVDGLIGPQTITALKLVGTRP